MESTIKKKKPNNFIETLKVTIKLTSNDLKIFPKKETIRLLSFLVVSSTIVMLLVAHEDHVFAKKSHRPSSSSSTPTASATNSTTSQGTGNVPVETNQFSKGLDITNTIVYLNSSDGHYHLKGLAKNTLPETRSNSVYMTIDFQDKSTGTSVKSVPGNINGPIDPGQTVPFDVDTGYTGAQGNQLQFMKVQITYS